MLFNQLKQKYESIQLSSFLNLNYKENFLDAMITSSTTIAQKKYIADEYLRLAEYAENLGYSPRVFAPKPGSKAHQLINKAHTILSDINKLIMAP